jgi:hypothetical protein
MISSYLNITTGWREAEEKAGKAESWRKLKKT